MGAVMNETVKAALLAERLEAQEGVGWAESNQRNVEARLVNAQTDVVKARQRFDDLNAFLRDNGVDLAAVDAAAAKARAAESPSGLVRALTSDTQNLSLLSKNMANGIQANRQ